MSKTSPTNPMTGLSRLALVLLLSQSCNVRTPDLPPDISAFDPHLAVTHSIDGLKAMNGAFSSVTGGDTTLITTDVVICGVVAADDKSGNFYKQLVVQDSTGGIMVNVDAYSLYNDYPIGRKIYIRAKGLTLGYDGGLPQLGYGVGEDLSVGGIPGGRLSEFLIKGPVGQPVNADTISFSSLYKGSPTAIFDLGNPTQARLLNRLVTIPEVEFVNRNQTWTQPNSATSRDLRECGHPKLLVTRNSNFSLFAAQPVPEGRGTISGILTVYKGTGYATPQLVIRDTSDVHLYGVRCEGATIVAPMISIDSARKCFKGLPVKMPYCRITGTVITDASAKNVSSGLMTIQSGYRGINIYVGATTAAGFNPGDSLELTLNGDSLKSYQGMLEIEDEDFDLEIKKLASGRNVLPRTVTVAALLQTFGEYEATLVRITGATVQGGGTYSGNKTLSDGTGAVVLRTASGATFASQPVPLVPKTFTGMAGWFGTTKQLLLRNLADVQ